jgi:ribosome-interacting GTPase 1
VPANLTPDYLAAEERFRSAVTPEEKLEALEDMLATIPKHKGTEKMQADIKRRIAKIRQETQARAGSRKRPFYIMEKQGAGQVAIVGPPNSGKSQLLASLSNAEPEVAPYPFTTRSPLAGMVQFENVQIQLVDLPPLAPEGSPPWLMQVVRTSDALLIVFDLGDDNLLDQLDTTMALLRRGRVCIAEQPVEPGVVRKKAVIVGNKLDAPGASDRLALLDEAVASVAPGAAGRHAGGGDGLVLPVSARMGTGLDELRLRLFEVLDVIRVYTKAPGKPVDFSAPFVLKKGTTIVQAAAAVHKDIAKNLRYARVWGKTTFEGQMVQRDYVLAEGDVVEFHA